MANPLMWMRIVLLFFVAVMIQAETLDRIAVSIGKHVIAESEMMTEMRVTGFIDMAPLDLSPTAKRATAARLVDQYLILDDAAISRARLPARDTEVAKLIEPIRARYASNAVYQAALERAQLTEADLTQHFLNGLKLLRYSETRFRPEVDVTEADLRAAYEKVIADAKARLGSDAAPPENIDQDYAKNKDQLQQLIFAERLNQAMDRWLDMARGGANIQYRESVFQ